jgi:hypothetical protein
LHDYFVSRSRFQFFPDAKTFDILQINELFKYLRLCIMGYLRTMGAGLAGSTVRYKGVNVNMIQFGDKLQGLPPLTGTRRPHRIYKRKAGGQKPGRDTIFCVNQLGGMMVKNSQFAANADGVKECSNRKNHRHHGHHMTNHKSQGQGHTAISSSVSADNPAGNAPEAFGLLGSFLETPAPDCIAAEDANDTNPKIKSCRDDGDYYARTNDSNWPDSDPVPIRLDPGDEIIIGRLEKGLDGERLDPVIPPGARALGVDTPDTALVSKDGTMAYVKQWAGTVTGGGAEIVENWVYQCTGSDEGFRYKQHCGTASGASWSCLVCGSSP